MLESPREVFVIIAGGVEDGVVCRLLAGLVLHTLLDAVVETNPRLTVMLFARAYVIGIEVRLLEVDLVLFAGSFGDGRYLGIGTVGYLDLWNRGTCSVELLQCCQ